MWGCKPVFGRPVHQHHWLLQLLVPIWTWVGGWDILQGYLYIWHIPLVVCCFSWVTTCWPVDTAVWVYFCFFVTDINECLTMAGICGEGNCLNTEGSYRCMCPDGFTTTDGGSGCQGNGKWSFISFYQLYVTGWGRLKTHEMVIFVYFSLADLTLISFNMQYPFKSIHTPNFQVSFMLHPQRFLNFIGIHWDVFKGLAFSGPNLLWYPQITSSAPYPLQVCKKLFIVFISINAVIWSFV